MPFILALTAAVALSEPPIIVTGSVRTEKVLADCLARKCPVREDAVASIKHAQSQFADGAYRDARLTLMASIQRNRGAEAQDPRAVSALWHALGRVTLHDGDVTASRRATMRAGSILARAKSLTDSERQQGAIQVADMMAVSGDATGAIRRYLAMSDRARAEGNRELANMLMLRALNVQSAGGGSDADAKLSRIANDPSVSSRVRMMAWSIIAKRKGAAPSDMDALLKTVPGAEPDEEPRLLWSPSDPLEQQARNVAREAELGNTAILNLVQPRGADLRGKSWVDIGFWIRPDGTVAEPEVLRASGRVPWAAQVVEQFKLRRYAPIQKASAPEGLYKIERVTLTFDYATPIGSLIRRRSGLPSYRTENLRIEKPAVTTDE